MRRREDEALKAPRSTKVVWRIYTVVLICLAMTAGGLVLAPPAVANYNCWRGGHDCSLHWHGHHMHWHFTDEISGKREAVREGAQRWENTSSEFYFVEDAASDSHIWQEGISCPGSCVIVAETHLSGVSGDHILEMDIHFNANLNFNNNVDACPNGQPYDTMGIGMHEWGHALGLDENNVDNPRPTMKQGDFPKCWARTLEQSDRDGQKAIYDNSPGD